MRPPEPAVPEADADDPAPVRRDTSDDLRREQTRTWPSTEARTTPRDAIGGVIGANTRDPISSGRSANGTRECGHEGNDA